MNFLGLSKLVCPTTYVIPVNLQWTYMIPMKVYTEQAM